MLKIVKIAKKSFTSLTNIKKVCIIKSTEKNVRKMEVYKCLQNIGKKLEC